MRARQVAIVLVAGVAQLSFGQVLFSTGFESPYTVGALSSQDGWMVTPAEAVGSVQTARVQSGVQAVELIDAASFGRAQRSVTGTMTLPILTAGYGMYFDDSWAANQVEDRFEAQMRVEATGSHGVFGIEFGVVKASANGYQTLPGNTSAFYIEVGTESAMGPQTYTVMNFGDWQGAWHNFGLSYDNDANMVRLYVDNILQAQVASNEDILSVSNVQLQNQRWGTNPQNNASLYFDNVYIAAVPEPATLAILATGAAFLLKRRSRQRR